MVPCKVFGIVYKRLQHCNANHLALCLSFCVMLRHTHPAMPGLIRLVLVPNIMKVGRVQSQHTSAPVCAQELRNKLVFPLARILELYNLYCDITCGHFADTGATVWTAVEASKGQHPHTTVPSCLQKPNSLETVVASERWRQFSEALSAFPRHNQFNKINK